MSLNKQIRSAWVPHWPLEFANSATPNLFGPAILLSAVFALNWISMRERGQGFFVNDRMGLNYLSGEMEEVGLQKESRTFCSALDENLIL